MNALPSGDKFLMCADANTQLLLATVFYGAKLLVYAGTDTQVLLVVYAVPSGAKLLVYADIETQLPPLHKWMNVEY